MIQSKPFHYTQNYDFSLMILFGAGLCTDRTILRQLSCCFSWYDSFSIPNFNKHSIHTNYCLGSTSSKVDAVSTKWLF